MLSLNGAPPGTLLSLHPVGEALADDFGPQSLEQGKPPSPRLQSQVQQSPLSILGLKILEPVRVIV